MSGREGETGSEKERQEEEEVSAIRVENEAAFL